MDSYSNQMVRTIEVFEGVSDLLEKESKKPGILTEKDRKNVIDTIELVLESLEATWSSK